MYYTRTSGPMHPYTFFPSPRTPSQPPYLLWPGRLSLQVRVWCVLSMCTFSQFCFNSRFNFLYSGIIIILTIDWLPQLFLFLEKAFVVCQHYHKFHCVFLV